MNKISLAARSVSLAAAMGLAMTVGAPAVIAQVDPGAGDAAASPLVNPNATGSLTIHKKADPNNLGTPTGNVDPNVTGEPLAGVGFTIYKINGIDLTTNEGLAAAANIKPADYLTPQGQADLAKVSIVGAEQMTDGQGQIEYRDLALGAYLVLETSPKDGYSPASPFIAFVPMTQNNAAEGGVSWNYNVHAYPKNYSQQTPEKEVVDTGQNVGDTITYKVSGYAQTVDPATQQRTIFRIEDTLDPKLTPPTTDQVTVEGFTPGVDYEVTVEGQKVTINFLEAGLNKLQNNQKVTATIPATVKEQANGDVVNKALVFENNPNTGQENTPKETPDVHTYYGGVKFTKVEAGTENALAGAEFQVYGVQNGQACTKDAVDNKTLDLMTVVGQDGIYRSGQDGQVVIDGLHVNDYADGKETPNKYTSYCLVETKSPAGFELLAKPVEFTVLKQNAGQNVNINQTGKIENLKDTTPNLPMTGGMGIGILAAIGAALAAAGAWFARRGAKN